MDTSKLTVKLPVDQFYNSYVETIRNLYTDSFISQNHLEPSTCSSFQRAMSKRAGISLDKREDTKQYTKDDLAAIVADTNSKYEEYSFGDYSEGTKTRGEARYRLLSTILKATLSKLGYDDIASQFKYAEDSKDTVEENVDQSYSAALAAEKEDTTEVRQNIELLRSSLSSIKIKIEEFSKKKLSTQDKESLQKLKDTLKDTVESAVKCAEGRDDASVLVELIEQGKEYIMKIQEILDDKKKEELQQVSQQKDIVVADQSEVPYNDIMRVLKVLPSFVERLQEVVKQNEELLAQVNSLKAEVETVKKKKMMPENEEDLVQLIKEAASLIHDKNNLKDVALFIALKGMG